MTESLTAESPIIVTGCDRSGTSMTAGIINHSGAFGGSLSDDPNHRYENAFIQESIIRRYLGAIQADPRGQDPLPPLDQLVSFPGLGHIITGILETEGHKGGPWFLKCNQACLIWPIFHKAFPKAQWVVVRRDDIDIVNSCMKTTSMDAYSTEAEWQGWVDHHKLCFQGMAAAGLSVVEVWPSRFVDGDLNGIQEVVANLGLNLDIEFAMSFIDQSVWKGN